MSLLTSLTSLQPSNLGASRAVVCCAGEAQELSKDHVPNDEREGKRLESGKGGKLSEHGMVVGSFNGKEYTSPITRSIGNAHLKRLGVVTCRAEVSERELSRQDAFLLIASDQDSPSRRENLRPCNRFCRIRLSRWDSTSSKKVRWLSLVRLLTI